MAFNKANLYKVGGAVPGVWHYQTADAIATVTASGYFNDATNELHQFDTIDCVSSTGGTVAVDKLVVTSASQAATVTTTNGT